MAGDATMDSLYVKLGQARLDATQKNIDRALNLVDEVIKKNASSTDAWLLKGHLEMAKKDFASAAESYTKAYQISPKASQYTLFISRALVLDKQMDKAQPYVDAITSTVTRKQQKQERQLKHQLQEE